MSKKQAGFTLMELMVTIAIIAILSSIAIPNAISWRNNAQVNSAARSVYSDLQNARSAAVKENMSCRIEFDVVNGSYTIALVHPLSGNIVRNLKTVSFSDKGAVALKNVEFPEGGSGGVEITFRSTGFPYNSADELSGGIVEIEGVINKRIVLTPAGNVRIETI